MRKTLPVLAALALLAGCAELSNIARSAFQQPKLTFRSATLDALDLEGATIGFHFDLENPNTIGVDLARVAWGIEVEGTRVATGEMPGGLKVPPNGTAPIAFAVRVRFRDVPGFVSLIGSGKNSIQYRLTGALGVRTPLGVVELPLSHEDVLRLPGMPRFSLEGLAVRSITFTEVTLGVRLRVQNPNVFPLPSSRFDCSLALAGSQVASAQSAPLVPVPGSQAAVVEIPVRFSLVSAGRAASAIARGGDVEVALDGIATLAGIPLPVKLHATLPVRR
ncbi:MAG TPA: LEA type 2 family protein [Anaeromyxobacteraceae bacterium]|nr:LEA type 2 family protein [Anaeromyxobacteraceae bacterium]